MPAEEPDVLELRQIDLLPLVEPSWMRPDEQTGLPEDGVGAAANVLNPAFGEFRLVRGVLEQRRADVQDVGPGRVEVDVLAELFARARWLTAEPLVVALRARHDDPLGRHTMQLDGLTASASRSRRSRDLESRAGATCWTSDPSCRRRAPFADPSARALK